MTDEHTVALLVQIPRELRTRLRIAAAMQETTIAVLVAAALDFHVSSIERTRAAR